MKSILLLNANIVNEGHIFPSDIYIADGFISQISPNISSKRADIILDLKGKYVLPGVIDDQVHFREPGLTHKANIASESKAAVAGGITSFMEMPNTVPNATTQKLLEDKYSIGANSSLANYSFFMGATNDNMEEVLKTNPKNVCGIKIFMGSSTGNMLVDNEKTLENIFKNAPMLIATHCEDEETIKKNIEEYKKKYGENISPEYHAEIRSEEACYKSSSMAVELAKKFNTRLHILHISTEKEIQLFTNEIPLRDKKITAEVCVHHLYFDKGDYKKLGNLIKWNPAIKEAHNKEALLKGLLDDKLDIIATDHAPHTAEEKQKNYWEAPSGGPLVQHSLNIMLEFYKEGKISLERIAQKMAHAPAICFQVKKRGFIREGYWADFAIVDLNDSWEVSKSNILYKCGWSALEGKRFSSKITHTIVSGHLAYAEGKFDESKKGERLLFNR
ncbi:MAG: dihydroorotase [Cytophagaceae bacterium]|nr:dihydroorotase [Cytophagaceae bacterium]